MQHLLHLTVAAIAQVDGRFLLVEEHASGALAINQPAGHVEAGEPVLAACRRETLEEAAWEFEPEALVGIYRYMPPDCNDTYVRIAFCGRLVAEHARPLDPAIVRPLWMTHDEVAGTDPARLRSPMVLACIEDYLDGVRHPLSLLRDYGFADDR